MFGAENIKELLPLVEEAKPAPMAGKPVPFSHEPPCQWNQEPITLIHQSKNKRERGWRYMNNKMGKSRKWPAGNPVLST